MHRFRCYDRAQSFLFCVLVSICWRKKLPKILTIFYTSMVNIVKMVQKHVVNWSSCVENVKERKVFRHYFIKTNWNILVQLEKIHSSCHAFLNSVSLWVTPIQKNKTAHHHYTKTTEAFHGLPYTKIRWLTEKVLCVLAVYRSTQQDHYRLFEFPK